MELSSEMHRSQMQRFPWVAGLVFSLALSGCSFDVSGIAPDANNNNGPPYCGNGVLDQGEDCDGDELNGMTCEDHGYPAGTLSCASNCVFNLSGCSTCGNGAVDSGEHCDGAELNGATCTSQGFTGGDLACGTDCLFDTSGCTGTGCGDLVIQPPEECDGSNLNGQTCETYSGPNFSGVLSCDTNCQYDASGCIECGNGVVEGAEECDGADLNGNTCTSLSYDGGNLACAQNCVLDPSDCSICGNGTAETGEQCDGADLGGADCISQGFDGGTLDCGGTCAFDTSGCRACGNGVLESPEECDDGTANSDVAVDGCRTNCLTAWCGDGVCDTGEGLTCIADCGTVLFSDDFEGSWPDGWATYDEWYVSSGYDTWGPETMAAHSGSMGLWCSGDGSPSVTYDDRQNSWARRNVDLTAAAGHTTLLDVWVSVDIADSADYFEVSYRPNGGSGWTVLENYTGNTNGWVLRSYDISAEAGNPDFEIQFLFVSDWSNSGTFGVYLDDLVIGYFP